MKYAKHLYLSEGLDKKKEKIIKKLERGKFNMDIYILTLPDSANSNLEIYHSILLLQPSFPCEDFYVVGLAKGYDEALELVEEITKQVYNETQGTDIRSYILEREQED